MANNLVESKAASAKDAAFNNIKPEVPTIFMVGMNGIPWIFPVCDDKIITNRWASGDSALILAPTGVLSVKKPYLLQGGE